jgi:DNA mismatch repair protein MutS
MTIVKSLSDEYFDHYEKYTQEYGGKTCIFMQVGSFYEMQKIVVDDVLILGNLDEVASILNIQVTRKNKKVDPKPKEKLLYFAGFPKQAAAKFLPVLLEHGFTVVIIDETKGEQNKIVRAVSNVYSPSIYPLDMMERCLGDGNNLTSIFIETHPVVGSSSDKLNQEICVLYSVGNINTSTNKFEMYERSSVGSLQNQIVECVLDDIQRLMVRYNSNEILLVQSAKKADVLLQEQTFVDYLDLHHKSVHFKTLLPEEYKEWQNIDQQNAYLRKVYKQNTNVQFGLLQPIDHLDLSQQQLCIMNCIHMLRFISRHDAKYIENIAPPEIINEYNHLVLELNTSQQLCLLPSKKHGKFSSLFDVINMTQTVIGKRGLKSLLSKPLRKKDDIQRRYAFTEALETLSKDNLKALDKFLEETCDFEKLHRRMSLQALHPYEFYNLHLTYKSVIGIVHMLDQTDNEILHQMSLTAEQYEALNAFMNDYNSVFKINEMKKYNLSENAFTIENYLVGVGAIDTVEEKIKILELELEDIRKMYESKMNPKAGTEADWLKIAYLDQDGYYLTCTKLRSQLLLKELNKSDKADITIKDNTNVCKITNSRLKKISAELVNNRELFVKLIKQHYLKLLGAFATKYSELFEVLRQVISLIDITRSNVKCKNAYNYCKPSIVDAEESFLAATQIRHPIIERVNEDTVYVPNDIKLDSNECGMILYALNSCGKSSLLRSVGLSIVLAQCGLYVPCKEFVYSPFHNIVTQVDMVDNLWKAQSSFVSEMIGLKNIMKAANKRCLVLSDELTKGTEVVSATSIFAASVLQLVQKQCKFIFTTHLQDVAKLELVKSSTKLQICHLSVDVQDDVIIFERKLKVGPCSELYGLEVAKAVGLDKELMDLSFAIRNDMTNNTETGSLSTAKKSRYNAKKRLESCEICSYAPVKQTDMPLDTHHIKFQCNADTNSFNGHFHKNSKFNLVCLCKECHVKVHNGNINIRGYIDTSQGKTLDFTKN